MFLNPSSSEEEVVEYISARCGFLLTSHSRAAFSGIDGEAFLGLTPITLDMVLPNLTVKEKGLLLAKIETLRNFCFTKDTPVQPRTPAEVRDVTPPPAFRRAESPPQSPVRKLSLPPPPCHPSTELPRILIELWLENDGSDRFLAETWLPRLTELDLHANTLRLALKRSVHSKDSDSVRHGRKWFGSLILSARFHRIDSRLELFLAEVRDVESGGENFFLKIFSLAEKLTLLFVSAKHPLGGSGSNSCLIVDEEVNVQFGGEKEEELEVAQSPKRGDLRRRRSRSIVGKEERCRSITPPPVGVSVDLFKSIMRGRMSEGTSGPPNTLSLYDLLLLANKGDIFQLSPRYTRFEAYLLPTHEVSAHFGSQYVLRAVPQLEALKTDSEYMHSHAQVVELLLLSFGFGEDEPKGSWSGHSWLLRHALLSCILLASTESARRIVKVGKSLQAIRQLDSNETGFGEALFTLMADKEAADAFWDEQESVSMIKLPAYLPPPRTTLGGLIQFVARGMTL